MLGGLRRGTSQNAGMDDEVSPDHVWGPYLTFLLRDKAWRLHGRRPKRALLVWLVWPFTLCRRIRARKLARPRNVDRTVSHGRE